jgi:hypothetical protein
MKEPEKFTVLVPVEKAVLDDPDYLPFVVHFIFEEKLNDERGTRTAGPLRLTEPEWLSDYPEPMPEGWTIIRIDGVGIPG